MSSLALLFCVGATHAATLPTVSSFTPATGKPGTSVKITGSNFSTAKNVSFNTVSAVFFIESATVIYATVPEGALTGPISVNNTSGGGASFASFTVAPRLDTLTPDRGLSGRKIVIGGANLANTTNVYFGGIAASFTVTSDTQINAFVPTGASNAPVKVMTTVGNAITTNDFLITGAPIIRSFTPTVASVGSIVVIDGGDFTGVTNVLFNGQAASGFAITAQNQLQAQIPATATVGRITVRTPGGEAISDMDLITGAGPIVTNFSPRGGPVGKLITITGTGFTGINFSGIKFNNTVSTFGGATADNLIQVQVPSGATTGPIKLTKGTNTFITSSNFTVGAFPIITNVNPQIGSVNAQVTIQGENLSSVTSVRFGSKAASFFVVADSQITATVPSGATNAPIYVANSSFTNVSDVVFTVNGAAPTIVDFSPRNGSPGSIVTLYGYNFNNATAVKLNGQSVSYTVTSVSGTNQISTTLPGNATSGTFTVTTAGGTGTSTNSFYVWPHISGFTPVKASALSSLMLTGVNFTATSELRIGDVPVTIYSVTDNSHISFFVPEQAVSGPITIKTPAGLMTTITNFAMLPKINTLTPDRGRVGDTVLIDGSGFFNVTSVKFNGISAVYTNDSVNRITAKVPSGVSSGVVTVVTGEGTTNSANAFLIYPTVTDFTPKSGPYGTTVVLNGLNFTDVTNVVLSNIDVPYTINSSTKITATIPVAQSGNLVLLNPAGVTVVSDVFTVEPRLQVLSTTDGKLVMQWPKDAPTFRVQYTESLTPPVIWSDESVTAYLINNLWTVTNEPPATNRFLRLIFQFPE